MLMRQDQQKGFTLIEVMVTMAIIAVGMLAMATMLIDDMHFNQNSEHRIDGAGIAQSVMAMAQNKAESNAAYTGETVNFAHIPSGQAVVTVVDLTGATKGRWITVVFSWNEHGDTKQVELRSLGVIE